MLVIYVIDLYINFSLIFLLIFLFFFFSFKKVLNYLIYILLNFYLMENKFHLVLI